MKVKKRHLILSGVIRAFPLSIEHGEGGRRRWRTLVYSMSKRSEKHEGYDKIRVLGNSSSWVYISVGKGT